MLKAMEEAKGLWAEHVWGAGSLTAFTWASWLLLALSGHWTVTTLGSVISLCHLDTASASPGACWECRESLVSVPQTTDKTLAPLLTQRGPGIWY